MQKIFFPFFFARVGGKCFQFSSSERFGDGEILQTEGNPSPRGQASTFPPNHQPFPVEILNSARGFRKNFFFVSKEFPEHLCFPMLLLFFGFRTLRTFLHLHASFLFALFSTGFITYYAAWYHFCNYTSSLCYSQLSCCLGIDVQYILQWNRLILSIKGAMCHTLDGSLHEPFFFWAYHLFPHSHFKNPPKPPHEDMKWQ